MAILLDPLAYAMGITLATLWALCVTFRHAPAPKPVCTMVHTRRYAALADFGRLRVAVALEVRYA